MVLECQAMGEAAQLTCTHDRADACMGALAWYFLGYSLAFDVDDRVDGHMANAFIGGGPTHFALSGVKDNMDAHAHGYDWISFFFQYAFAAAAGSSYIMYPHVWLSRTHHPPRPAPPLPHTQSLHTLHSCCAFNHSRFRSSPTQRRSFLEPWPSAAS